MNGRHATDDLSFTPDLGEVLDFMRLIWAVDHALQRRSKWMEAVFGVTGPQRLVLRIVGKFPGIPAVHLAKLLYVHPSTLSGILKRLKRQGLIRRRADPRDARRFLLSLTDKGRLLDVEAEGTIEASVQRVLGQARANQVEGARALLRSLAESLSPLSLGGEMHAEEG